MFEQINEHNWRAAVDRASRPAIRGTETTTRSAGELVVKNTSSVDFLACDPASLNTDNLYLSAKGDFDASAGIDWEIEQLSSTHWYHRHPVVCLEDIPIGEYGRVCVSGACVSRIIYDDVLGRTSPNSYLGGVVGHHYFRREKNDEKYLDTTVRLVAVYPAIYDDVMTDYVYYHNRHRYQYRWQYGVVVIYPEFF